MNKLKGPSFWTKLFYRSLGVTTLHLQHEISLLLSLSFLTTASLLSLYRNTFGKSGDYWYIFLTTAWLSRHLLFRLICTADASTSVSRTTFTSITVNFFTQFVSAGQYFDMPQAHVSISSSNNFASGGDHGDGVGGGIMGVDHPIPPHRSKFVNQYILKPVVRIWGIGTWVKSKLGSRKMVPKDEFDFLLEGSTINGGNGNRKGYGHSSHNHHGNHPQHHKSSKLHGNNNHNILDENEEMRIAQIQIQLLDTLNRKLDKLWVYIPRAQFCLALVIMTVSGFTVANWWNDSSNGSGGHSYWNSGEFPIKAGFNPALPPLPPRGPQDQTPPMQSFIPSNGLEFANGQLMAQKFNAAQKQTNKQNTSSFFHTDGFINNLWIILNVICIWGTISCLIVYGRIIPPIPDLANNNPRTSKGGNSKSSKPRSLHTSMEMPWAESYKSIAGENRFRLHFKVACLRIFENIILCSILPQTAYVCRVSGHCYTEPMFWELNGIHGVTGIVGRSMFDSIIHDRLASFVILFSVILITSLSLVVQAATLDRNHLALLGYFSKESSGINDGSYCGTTINGKSSPSVVSRRSGGNDGNSGRRGSKRSNAYTNGDENSMAMHQHFNSRVTESTGDRKFLNISLSLDIYRRATYNIFANEMGHVSTSWIIAECVRCYAIFSMVLVGFCILQHVQGAYYSLVLVFIAAFNSAGSTDVGLLEFTELENIANEISSGVS